MNKMKCSIYLLTLIFCLGMIGCKKKEGCTDPNSPSFLADADKNDGSCETTGDVLEGTWTVEITVNSGVEQAYSATVTKVNNDTIRITPLFVNIHLIGSLEVVVEWLPRMIKGTNNNVSYVQNIGGSITDEDEFEVLFDAVGIVNVDNYVWRLSR